MLCLQEIVETSLRTLKQITKTALDSNKISRTDTFQRTAQVTNIYGECVVINKLI